MSYKIIVDSCGELTDEMKASDCFETASLEIDVEDIAEVLLPVPGALYGRVSL